MIVKNEQYYQFDEEKNDGSLRLATEEEIEAWRIRMAHIKREPSEWEGDFS